MKGAKKRMIRIGFDDSDPEALRDSIVDRVDGTHYDTGERSLKVYIPPKHIERLKTVYSEVTVHDFGDDYHISEEEKERKSKYYKAFKGLNQSKKKIRKLKDYVEIMRMAMHCLDLVAQDNGMMDPEKFKIKVLEGKIIVEGLRFPKYIGKDRKQLSSTYLAEFILSGKPMSEFSGLADEDEYLSDEELAACEKDLFDEKDWVENSKVVPEEEQGDDGAAFFDPENDVQPENSSVFVTEKQYRKFLKTNPVLIRVFKDIRKELSDNEQLDRIARSDFNSADFEEIEKYDNKHKYVQSSEMPEFKGDVMNDDDYYRYLYELEEWMNTHTKVRVEGKMKTPEEINMLNLKDLLESSGWDIRNLYNNREEKKRLERAIKRDEKKERKVKDKLLKIQERKARRMGEPKKKEGGNRKERKRIKGSGKSKKGKKSNSNEYKDAYKADAMEATEQLLLNAVDRGKDDFSDYKDDALDWSWDTIMKGDYK